MSGSALMTPATFATSAIPAADVAPSGVLTSATRPPSARSPLALCSRSTARVDCELGSWKPPTWSDFATGPPNTPDNAANTIATPTITHGALLINRPNLSNITFLTPSQIPNLLPAAQTNPRTSRGARFRTS